MDPEISRQRGESMEQDRKAREEVWNQVEELSQISSNTAASSSWC